MDIALQRDLVDIQEIIMFTPPMKQTDCHEPNAGLDHDEPHTHHSRRHHHHNHNHCHSHHCRRRRHRTSHRHRSSQRRLDPEAALELASRERRYAMLSRLEKIYGLAYGGRLTRDAANLDGAELGPESSPPPPTGGKDKVAAQSSNQRELELFLDREGQRLREERVPSPTGNTRPELAARSHLLAPAASQTEIVMASNKPAPANKSVQPAKRLRNKTIDGAPAIDRRETAPVPTRPRLASRHGSFRSTTSARALRQPSASASQLLLRPRRRAQFGTPTLAIGAARLRARMGEPASARTTSGGGAEQKRQQEAAQAGDGSATITKPAGGEVGADCDRTATKSGPNGGRRQEREQTHQRQSGCVETRLAPNGGRLVNAHPLAPLSDMDQLYATPKKAKAKQQVAGANENVSAQGQNLSGLPLLASGKSDASVDCSANKLLRDEQSLLRSGADQPRIGWTEVSVDTHKTLAEWNLHNKKAHEPAGLDRCRCDSPQAGERTLRRTRAARNVSMTKKLLRFLGLKSRIEAEQLSARTRQSETQPKSVEASGENSTSKLVAESKKLARSSFMVNASKSSGAIVEIGAKREPSKPDDFDATSEKQRDFVPFGMGIYSDIETTLREAQVALQRANTDKRQASGPADKTIEILVNEQNASKPKEETKKLIGPKKPLECVDADLLASKRKLAQAAMDRVQKSREKLRFYSLDAISAEELKFARESTEKKSGESKSNFPASIDEEKKSGEDFKSTTEISEGVDSQRKVSQNTTYGAIKEYMTSIHIRSGSGSDGIGMSDSSPSNMAPEQSDDFHGGSITTSADNTSDDNRQHGGSIDSSLGMSRRRERSAREKPPSPEPPGKAPDKEPAQVSSCPGAGEAHRVANNVADAYANLAVQSRRGSNGFSSSTPSPGSSSDNQLSPRPASSSASASSSNSPGAGAEQTKPNSTLGRQLNSSRSRQPIVMSEHSSPEAYRLMESQDGTRATGESVAERPAPRRFFEGFGADKIESADSLDQLTLNMSSIMNGLPRVSSLSEICGQRSQAHQQQSAASCHLQMASRGQNPGLCDYHAFINRIPIRLEYSSHLPYVLGNCAIRKPCNALAATEEAAGARNLRTTLGLHGRHMSEHSLNSSVKLDAARYAKDGVHLYGNNNGYFNSTDSYGRHSNGPVRLVDVINEARSKSSMLVTDPCSNDDESSPARYPSASQTAGLRLRQRKPPQQLADPSSYGRNFPSSQADAAHQIIYSGEGNLPSNGLTVLPEATGHNDEAKDACDLRPLPNENPKAEARYVSRVSINKVQVGDEPGTGEQNRTVVTIKAARQTQPSDYPELSPQSSALTMNYALI